MQGTFHCDANRLAVQLLACHYDLPDKGGHLSSGPSCNETHTPIPCASLRTKKTWKYSTSHAARSFVNTALNVGCKLMFGAVEVKSDPNPPSCVPKESVDSKRPTPGAALYAARKESLAYRVLLMSFRCQIDYAAKTSAAASMAAIVLCSSDEASELFPASTASVIPG